MNPAVQLNKVVVLSRSGSSAESGLPTFRDSKGRWNEYSWHAVAPALQPKFMDGRAHQELRARIHGCFVEMPLELALAQGQTPKPPAPMPQAIAHRTPAPVPQEAVNS